MLASLLGRRNVPAPTPGNHQVRVQWRPMKSPTIEPRNYVPQLGTSPLMRARFTCHIICSCVWTNNQLRRHIRKTACCLAGFLDEMAWHSITSELSSSVLSAVSAPGVTPPAKLGCIFGLSMAGLVVGFIGGFLMSFLGCTQGFGSLCIAGIVMSTMFVASLAIFMTTVTVWAPASNTAWCREALDAVNSTGLPSIQRKYPNMQFTLTDLRLDANDPSFDVRVSPPAVAVVVTAEAVQPVASAPPAHALESDKGMKGAE